jgi:hypothetical protein
MQEKLVTAIAGKRFTKLLQGPIRCWRFGHVEVNQTSGSDLESNKYIQDTELYCYGDKEVASNNLTRVIAEKIGPALIFTAVRDWGSLDIFADSAR